MGLTTASALNNDLRPQDRVVGYYLYDDQEREVSAVRDLVVDRRTRRPRYLVIEIGGLMGVAGIRLLIPWGAVVKGGVSRLNIRWPAEHVLAAPTPTEPTLPTEAEEESIHHHFGLVPYWIDETEDEIVGGAETASLPEPSDIDVPSNLTLEKDDEK